MYLIKQYPLSQGALEIQYIEEFFLDFPRKKTAAQVVARLEGREHQILMAEAALPHDPSTVVPVAFKVAHELRADETEPQLADLVHQLRGCVQFEGRKIHNMRATLDRLRFNTVKFEPHPTDNRESKIYLSKQLARDLLAQHASVRAVTRVGDER